MLSETLQRYAGTLGQRGFARLLLAVLGNTSGLVAIGDDYKLIACLRQTFHAENLDWRRRRSFFQLGSAIVKHGAHFAVDVADDEVVAGTQRTILHEHSRYGAATAIEFGFEDHATRAAVRRSLQLFQISDQTNHFHQQVQVRFLFRRDVHKDSAAAPFFRYQSPVCELLLHAIRQRLGLVNLVHRYDDRHFGGVRVVNSFEGLRHHTIIGRHDEDDDVCRLGAPRAHPREGFMSRRIEENNFAAIGR